MRLMTKALPTIIQQAIDDQGLSVREGARKCGLSLGSFTAVLYSRTQRPAPEILEAISEGLNIPYTSLALAAYGVINPANLMPATA